MANLEDLKKILSEMDVPSYRIDDLNWLSRNLGVRNSKHPRYQEAMEILKELLAPTLRKKDVKQIFGN